MNKNDMHIEMLKLTYANGIWEMCIRGYDVATLNLVVTSVRQKKEKDMSNDQCVVYFNYLDLK
ncbi:hypothetical protein BLOT_015017 [Blomia tropicalis]|nr:hypothetical protein BLOT_015017 [Blomia tropicalis]